MTMEETARACQWDLEGTLRRFGGSQMMLERFVKKFPQDATFAALKDAAEQKNYPEVEKAAHTLKGIAGNLGFTALYQGCSNLVAAVRNGNFEQADTLWETVQQEYETVFTAVAQIEW